MWIGKKGRLRYYSTIPVTGRSIGEKYEQDFGYVRICGEGMNNPIIYEDDSTAIQSLLKCTGLSDRLDGGSSGDGGPEDA